MSELQYGCLEVSGAGLLSEMDVFSAASKYALNTPWTFACVCIPMAISSTRQLNKLQTPTMARFQARGLGTTSPCSVSLVAGWLGGYSQRQSMRLGEYSENAGTIHKYSMV
jgi:hypothetical protein